MNEPNYGAEEHLLDLETSARLRKLTTPPPADAPKCPYAKNEAAPCVKRDGDSARVNGSHQEGCVSCGHWVASPAPVADGGIPTSAELDALAKRWGWRNVDEADCAEGSLFQETRRVQHAATLASAHQREAELTRDVRAALENHHAAVTAFAEETRLRVAAEARVAELTRERDRDKDNWDHEAEKMRDTLNWLRAQRDVAEEHRATAEAQVAALREELREAEEGLDNFRAVHAQDFAAIAKAEAERDRLTTELTSIKSCPNCVYCERHRQRGDTVV